MYRFPSTILIFLALLCIVRAGNTDSQRCPSEKVFFDARTRQTYYAGPGREQAPPADVNEVLIGYFGPCSPSDPKGGDMWRAACLAVEQANKAGGYKGLPFRLVAGWSDNPWGSGVKEVARMAYVHKVWAVIGGIDGPSTHLAEQVVAKARLTLLSSASTDKTVNLANVPWMFSCLPGDHVQAPILARAIASRIGEGRFLLVSAVDHDSYLFTVELTRSFVKHRLVPFCHFEFKPGERYCAALAEEIVDAEAPVLVLIAAAQESARLISAVRSKGFKGLIFGGPQMGCRSFLEDAGKAAEGVVFPLLYAPAESSDNFEKTFARRFGHSPDYLAAHTYDGINLLIVATRKAGLNRARICDAVRTLSPWRGVTGSIQWDPLGSNSRSVGLGTIKKGRVRALTPNEPCGLP